MKTPQQLIEQLDSIRVAVSRTADTIREAETTAGQAEQDQKRELALAYRRATGSIKDRETDATLATTEFAKARRAAESILGWEKTKRANLELEQSNLQTQARLLDTYLRAEGVGRP